MFLEVIILLIVNNRLTNSNQILSILKKMIILSIYIENHPILGAIGGIIGGIFISILCGPIYLILRFIPNLIYVIRGYIAIANHQI